MATGTPNRRWVLAARPNGLIARTNFDWREEPVTSISDGQFLVRNQWLSCDPTQRIWMDVDSYIPAIPIGEPMLSYAAGEVVESRHPGYTAGDRVFGIFGWEDYTVSDGGGVYPPAKVPQGVDLASACSVLGMPGLTAYFGLLEVGRPQEGETVVVSGAAGSVGSLVCQIAKLRGCRVVGIAGGERKCRWLKEELGVDEAIDYKSEDVFGRLGALFGLEGQDALARLSERSPRGIDVFFDNVGGEVLDAALASLAVGGRVVICGAVSAYGDLGSPPALHNHLALSARIATMRGFLVFQFLERAQEALADLARWTAEGKVENHMDVVAGLENAPDALRRIFTGENVGKQLVEV